MIRSAQITDMNEVCELIYFIMQDKQSYFTENFPKDKVMSFIEHLYVQDMSYFSYKFILVQEIGAKVAGIALGYDGQLNTEFQQQWEPSVEEFFGNDEDEFESTEAQHDEFHLDTLAVLEAFRGQGVGSSLLTAAEQIARIQGHHKFSINVSEDNPNAQKLYERHGFVTESSFHISDHLYYHMIKPLL
ncbi:GNAT family N-acetyltransferase [Paenibacillus glacialis]|uniref:N-acetyltransferase domain-containing protein n=1 Tax=Paenibacillus glacialis TaxID=494026 RepID=A0A168MLK8_9BACL|nr:GNAT family N-acetyltransferase [Paenibacillus glacialis]OAB44816.1 hypothetical protein PGLA_05235 [Paenibacillus glacialis]